MTKENEKLALVKDFVNNTRCYLELHEWPACVAISSSIFWLCCAFVAKTYVEKKSKILLSDLDYEEVES